MAEMSPIDVLRRYQEYETELAPLLLGLLTLPEASLKTYAFVEEVKSLAPQIRPAILAPVPAAQGQLISSGVRPTNFTHRIGVNPPANSEGQLTLAQVQGTPALL